MSKLVDECEKVTIKIGESEIPFPKNVLIKSKMISTMIEDCATEVDKFYVPIHNIDKYTFTKIFTFIQQNILKDELLKDALEHETGLNLIRILLAIDYLEIKEFETDAIYTLISKTLLGKTTEELRSQLKIKNDLTKQEEKEYKEKIYWCTNYKSVKVNNEEQVSETKEPH